MFPVVPSSFYTEKKKRLSKQINEMREIFGQTLVSDVFPRVMCALQCAHRFWFVRGERIVAGVDAFSAKIGMTISGLRLLKECITLFIG